jgi:hypothetical protein
VIHLCVCSSSSAQCAAGAVVAACAQGSCEAADATATTATAAAECYAAGVVVGGVSCISRGSGGTKSSYSFWGCCSTELLKLKTAVQAVAVCIRERGLDTAGGSSCATCDAPHGALLARILRHAHTHTRVQVTCAACSSSTVVTARLSL